MKEDAQVDELALAEVFYADILEADVADEVVVSYVDGKASLIVHLLFFMVQDVDVDVVQVFHDFILLGIAVQSDKDGVGYVRPERGVLHGDVPAPAIESHTGGIHGGTVIGIAAEHAVEQYVVAGKQFIPSPIRRS